MQRPRLFAAALSSLAATFVAVPILATVALAADPVTVRSGDTLTAISKRHGVPIERLVELNRVPDPNRIHIGQRLRLEAGPPAPAPTTTAPASAPAAAAPRVHTVGSGENLTTIARHYDVTVAAIVAANGISNPGRIFGGQRLEIPGGAAPASTSTADPAAPRMPASMAELTARRESVRRVIVAEAERYGVPAAFALAVAWQESGWQQGVVSHAGAVGVMQLVPATGEWIGAIMLRTDVNIDDTHHNVRAGVRLLAHYLDRYDGNRDLVLAAYYQGQTAADRHGAYAVSRPYIASIKALTRIFGG